MEASLVLGKVFGLYLTIICFSMFLNRARMRETIIELVDNRPLLLVISIFTFILGTLAIVFHNIWVADWRVIITVLCWLTFLKGAVRLLFPGIDKYWVGMIDSPKFYNTSIVLMFFLGIYLLYQVNLLG